MTTVAAFDFDGTLTHGDTLLPFLLGGLGWPRFLKVLLVCAPWLAGYALRLVPNDVAKARLLRAALRGRTAAEIDAWTGTLLAALPARLRGWSLARLEMHRGLGHCCVMVSASPDIYLERIARQLGFDGLVCTAMQWQDGVLTGAMQTPNCHGQEKVRRLHVWLERRFGERWTQVQLHAYGDTAGDKPMLALAGAGCAWYRGRPWTPGA